MIGGPKGTREPIRAAIASYIAINGSAADCTDLKAAIRATILTNRPGVDLGHYKDDDHLDRMIDWVKSVHGDHPPMGWRTGPPPELVELRDSDRTVGGARQAAAERGSGDVAEHRAQSGWSGTRAAPRQWA